MDDLAVVVSKIMPELLSRPALSLALEQRAKFEGWLKIELAYALSSHASAVTFEEEYPGPSGKFRADLAVTLKGSRRYIMLKTVNTNFRFDGVETLHRPITRNIKGVIEDVVKLQSCPSETFPYILFAVFSVGSDLPAQLKQIGAYLRRIEQAGIEYTAQGIVERAGPWGIAWRLARVRSQSATTITIEDGHLD